MNGVSASGLIAQANAEVRAAEQVHHVRKAEAQRIRRPIAMVDELLNTLEELNLKRVSRVPLAYEPRLLQLRAMVAGTAVTGEQLDGLRTRVRITRLIEALFSVQEVLFAQLRPDIPREPDSWERRPMQPFAEGDQPAVAVMDERAPDVSIMEGPASEQALVSAA